MNEFDINAIQLKIQSPELTLDETFHDFILDHITKLGNLFNRINKCEMMLRKESSRKNMMEADIKIFVPGNMLYATGKHTDLRMAVTEAFHDVQEQLYRYKEKLKDHNTDGVTSLTSADLPDE
jgi:ribosomal subunit interface protein